MNEGELNALAKQVLDAAFAVHTVLGPGLLEAAYAACLAYELHRRQIPFERELLCRWSTEDRGLRMLATGWTFS